MGKRKRLVAEKRKEANKTTYFAKLNNCPTSPRKMRQVADLVRGMDVYKALSVLKFNTREASGRLEKLLKSAIANYESKKGEVEFDEEKTNLDSIIKAIDQLGYKATPTPV